MRRIEHVVVLMLENRSFDNVLGRLYPKSDRFEGLAMNEWNPWHREDGSVERVPVWSGDAAAPPTLPGEDPGEFFTDMKAQIYGLDRPGEPTMYGFVDNYMRQPRGERHRDPRAVMHVYRPEQLPSTTLLARSFGVCDRWFASAPCETWPNRYFLHCGTAGGYVNNERSTFPYRWPRFRMCALEVAHQLSRSARAGGGRPAHALLRHHRDRDDRGPAGHRADSLFRLAIPLRPSRRSVHSTLVVLVAPRDRRLGHSLLIYPDQGIATIGQLAFPAHRPLSLELTSDTVMQAFFVPALDSQIYAMAGMVGSGSARRGYVRSLERQAAGAFAR